MKKFVFCLFFGLTGQILLAGPLGFEVSEYAARRQKLMDQIPDGFAIIRNSTGKKPNLDFLVVDAGPAWEDYDTDIPISFPVNGKATPRQKEIYEACKAVSLACLEFYKPGITGFEVGAKVKELLISKGYNVETDAFSRLSFFKEGGITHSVGLATHDCGGRDVPKNVPLRAGMVFACDVFATFPNENLGVRVENTVLITENGCENLTARILR